MGSSTVDFRDRRFEALDAALAVWLELVVREIDAMKAPPPWLAELRDDWHHQAIAGFAHGIVPMLDRYVIDDERRRVLIGVSERALDSLNRWGDQVTADQLNALGTGGDEGLFLEDLPTEVFRRVGRYFVKLLRGNLMADETDSRIYPES